MSEMCSKMASFLFSAYFGGHFITIATVKVKLIPDLYTWVSVLINQSEEIGEKQFLFFSLKKRGQNSPLMHVALSCVIALMCCLSFAVFASLCYWIVCDCGIF